jgi:hypothetical protein
VACDSTKVSRCPAREDFTACGPKNFALFSGATARGYVI